MPELLGYGIQTLELLRRKHRRLYYGRTTMANISKSVWDHIMEKNFAAKLLPNIEIPSYKTHFDTLTCTCICASGLKFSPFVAHENTNLNLNYS